ncbi:uncharacterized protein N7477_008163 [Penicillium maclennaniae]|uniref:uncharacterized protein n=1 Tax=Penicillium maclennaniae TaxID=1343394 RepID=UPI002540AE32|nr:uncharacterized protein N7477_008163 [Penicillium maclennaniae]KAJ5665715.1 hypothetical protein N7477_008163 [Penicillium maclennaniae]
MSVCPVTYFEIQARLMTWTDELEFLGYILCELIDEKNLNTKGYSYHQAADLPAIIDIIRLHLKEPNGCLSKMMSEDERKKFRRLLRKSKDIRNAMAHHNIRNDARLHDLENVKERLSDMLEFAIRGAASDRGIYQVAWSPYYHICKTYMEMKGPLIVMVPLNEESLLSFRDRVLRDHDFEQKEVLHRRVKRKATEEGRRKQKIDYESALVRKQQRKERDIAMRSKHQSEKLGRIHQRFIKSQELGYTRLNKVKVWMKEERELFYRQRAEVLKDGIIHPTAEKELLFITILAVSSPLWLTVIFIYDMYNRTRGRYHRV